MIDSQTIALEYIKKEDFLGSYKGMRYRLSKRQQPKENNEKETETVIQVIIWPEPYNFLKTPEQRKQKKYFPFSKEGKEEAVNWLNHQYREQKSLWTMVCDR